MRAFITAFVAILGLCSPALAFEERCFPIDELLDKELPRLGGERWFAMQLNKEREAWYLLFEQSGQDGKKKEDGLWIVSARHSKARPDLYCIIGQGTGVYPLASMHQSSFDEKYGMPGSGFPRCGGNTGSPLDSIKVRAWASRELGKSVILGFGGGRSGSYTLLMSEDQYWIMLDVKDTGETCYFDRGDDIKAKELFLSKAK